MSAIAMNNLRSLAPTAARTKGDKTSKETLDLAWLCYCRVIEVPETDHEDWAVRMEDLWQLGGIDKGGPARSLEWEWVVSSHRKLAMRLHPDKINLLLNDPSCTLPAYKRNALRGLWSRVQQKHDECRTELRGGPPGVAPITGAEAVRVIQPTGPCIYVSCHAAGTDIALDEATEKPCQTTVRLYFPGALGNEDTQCIPMNVANGSAHVTLSEGDYP